MLAQSVVVEGELYMIARTGTALKVWRNADFDAISDSTNVIDGVVPVTTYDHAFGKIGASWYAFSAPYIGDSDTQYIDMYSSSSLTGPWSRQLLSNPRPGLWDYWSEFYTEGNLGFLFLTSEKDGYGRISFISLP